MERLSRAQRERVFAALDRYVATGAADIRKLTGRQDEWRLRVGDYRILFERDPAAPAIVVLAVRHRREAYRR
jgi:mRNA interferase RelE/StbE